MLSHSDLAAIFRLMAGHIENLGAVPQPSEPSKPAIDLNTVLGIQQGFNSLRVGNYPKLVEDGVHGPVTTFALKEFQATVGIPVTGEADEATVQAIYNAMFGTKPTSP